MAEPGDQCLFCGKPAVRYCDSALAMVWLGDMVKTRGLAPHKVTTMNYTCSAPACADHIRVVGWVCIEGDQDTVDRCVGCDRFLRGPVGLATPEEIERRRRDFHAHYRRTHFTVIG